MCYKAVKSNTFEEYRCNHTVVCYKAVKSNTFQEYRCNHTVVCYKAVKSNTFVGRWFPPGTPVSSTRNSFHRLDLTLAVAEALNPSNPKPYSL